MTKSTRWSLALLSAALLYALYTLALGEGGLRDLWSRQALIEEQQREKQRRSEHNQALGEKIESLRVHGDAIEELAREELGMVREGEVFHRMTPEGGGGEKGRKAPSSDDGP